MASSTAVKQGVVKIDRWLFWPGFVSVVTVAVLTILGKLPGLVSFLMIPVSLVGYAITSISILIAVVVLTVKKSPRRAASLLLVVITPLLLWSPIDWLTDYVHLGITVGFGGGPPSKPNGSAFAVHVWSVGLAGGASTFLIYDVTDQISLPIAQHTHPLNSENGFEEECAGKVRHLLGHYYVCKF